MKSIITIADIRPPGEGKQSARITTTGGESLWLWSSKLGLVKVGSTYEADVEEKNGFKNIKTVKQVESPAAPSQFTPRQAAAPSAAGAPFRTPEQITVAEITCAYISAGKCSNPAELKQTMQAICNAFRATWPDMEHYSEAAE
jgi:hypothetical protein